MQASQQDCTSIRRETRRLKLHTRASVQILQILTAVTGPLQRPPRASPHWQGRQEVQQVLSGYIGLHFFMGQKGFELR